MTRADGTETKRAALVLSGGAALGAAHLGAVQRLSDLGYQFDFYSGVSAGAIVAALLACGETPASAWKMIKETKIIRLMFDCSFRLGVIGGRKIQALFDKVFGDRSFADLSAPLYIGAVDFETGEPVTIASGRLADAVRASVSLPILMEPFYHPELNRWLIDGGIVENLPLPVATRNYAGNLIIAVDVATALPGPFDVRTKRLGRSRCSLMSSMVRTMRIILKSQQIGLTRDPRVRLVSPDTAAFRAFDLRRMDQLYAAGAQAVDKEFGYCRR